MSKQNQQWIDYLHAVYDQWSDKMPVIKDGISKFYISTDKVQDDSFWGAFEHAVRMIGFFNILPDRECDYWFELIDDQEYPTEEELDIFVNICKEGITKIIKDAGKQPTSTYWSSNCEFASLTTSIENMEGYWPYA